MKPSMQVLSLGCLLLLVVLFPSESIASEYQNFLETSYLKDAPGAAAVVVRDGETIFVGAAGLANLELGVELTKNSVFPIASLTKQITAAAILILQDQDKISVDDDITDYLSDYPTHGQKITIEHLLTHTSGISNYTRAPGYRDSGIRRKDLDINGVIDLFKDKPLNFDPGHAYEYSNSGYVLLGAIIERVSGQSYYEFVKENIFKKLGMSHTYNGNALDIVCNRVSGYTGEDAVFTNAEFISMTQAHAAGVLMSTVGDLALWANGLMNGTLISEDALNKMTSNYRLINGRYTGYGYGLNIGTLFEVRNWSHGGALSGFLTHAVWLPDHKVYVAVLQNQQTRHGVGPDYIAKRLALRAAGIANPLVENRSANLTKDLADLAGFYKVEGGNGTNISIVGEKVFIQDVGADAPWEMIPFAKDSFFFPGYFQTFVFVRNELGKISGMRIHADGNTESVIAKRIGNIPPK